MTMRWVLSIMNWDSVEIGKDNFPFVPIHRLFSHQPWNQKKTSRPDTFTMEVQPHSCVDEVQHWWNTTSFVEKSYISTVLLKLLLRCPHFFGLKKVMLQTTQFFFVNYLFFHGESPFRPFSARNLAVLPLFIQTKTTFHPKSIIFPGRNQPLPWVHRPSWHGPVLHEPQPVPYLAESNSSFIFSSQTNS